MDAANLINRLRSTAGALARQGNHEARDLMNEAADVIEDLDERIGIMEDGNQVTIAPEPGSIRKATWEEWWPGDCALIMTGEEKAWRCSNCDAKFIDREGYKFCPNCGAFMDFIPPKEVYKHEIQHDPADP